MRTNVFGSGGGLHGLEVPDPWQQEAVRALRQREDVVLSAPTGAGKTRVFEWWVEGGGARDGQTVYTVPTRALANDKYLEWKARGWRVGLVTGDRTVQPEAPILVATLETQRERFLKGEPPRLLAVDEYQLLTHPERGLHYEITLALAPAATQLLLLSGSVANPGEVAAWLRRLGRKVTLVETKERPVPLEELPVHNLPIAMGGKRETGFWPRVAQGVLRAGLTPLLIFAPRRAEAERIGRALAACLGPDPTFHPEETWRDWLGHAAWSALQRRVAVHHSGLTYPVRAGLLEPLAKFGHLDFIVATTGLAAGVNFSVRSVLLADTRVVEGSSERELRPDELLQMFGRAGRRGLDEVGTILTTPRGPGLLDACPLPVSGRAELEWPVLLRVMEDATHPAEQARDLLQRLFRRTPPTLGWPEEEAGAAATPEGFSAGGLGPLRREMMNAHGVWSLARDFVRGETALRNCWGRYREAWRPARQIPHEEFFPGGGRLCRLTETEGGFAYGREEPVARRLGESEDGRLELLPWVRKRLRLSRGEPVGESHVQEVVAGLLAGEGRTLHELVWRGPVLALRWSYANRIVDAWQDPDGQWLIDPPTRTIEARAEVAMGEAEAPWTPRRGTTLHAWRELGLVDAVACVTPRGRVVARFQGGEGLLIAAALEDPTYPVEEVVRDLANVRGGFRFSGLPPGGSERLAAAARACYGFRSYPGYLREGLPPGYGENTAEALQWETGQGWEAVHKFCPEAGRGDLERARLEWISLLRHLAHLPDLPGERGQALQAAAQASLLSLPEPPSPPALPGRWHQRPRK
jgi:hypothetical protein